MAKGYAGGTRQETAGEKETPPETTWRAARFHNLAPKERQRARPPLKFPGRFANRWEEFADLMSSGPVTVLLLYSRDGEAIQRWSEQLGHWDVDNLTRAGTLRKTWAIGTYNNLLHGSDSPEAVLRELWVVREHLRMFVHTT